MAERKYQVAVIGAGPAGVAAAIQLQRTKIKTVVFEKEEIGGLARNANQIENYLGFPEGITGKKFVEQMKKQVEKWELPIIREEVTKIDWKKKEEEFQIKTAAEKKYRCEYLLLATGTEAKKMGVPGEEQLVQEKLLFYEPIKLLEKGGPVKGKKIAIIGGGDAAFDYALNLAGKGGKITIYHRREEFKCLPILLERVRKKREKKKITIQTKKEIKELKRKRKTTKHEREKERTKGQKKIEIVFKDDSKAEADRIVIAIGRKPNKKLYQQISQKTGKEKKKVWEIGDVRNKSYRQIAIATGEGIKTAMKIQEIIKRKKEETMSATAGEESISSPAK